nr:hypothetical protein [Tanacetum cinerariifolium]
YCCSEGCLGDSIICDLDKTPDLSQRSPQNCPKCGNPVDGHYCQGCALLRKKFKEDLFPYCIKNGILQDSFEPSYDNTNVVNALREPFVGNQDPGKNSSQSPPQINHHCCYECGDPLEDIFCHQCTCELCGRGAHYGYNFPPKVPVFPDQEPFNNQTVDELPQTLPSFDTTCYSEDGNSFTYDSTSNLVHDSPNVFSPPLQLPIYSYEFCGNDAYYGHDCLLQFPVIHQLIREKTCAELLAEEQEANIDTQPFQYFVIPQRPQEEMSVLSLAWETILEIELAFEDKHCQPGDILELFQRLQTDVQTIHEELGMYINTPNWDRHTVCYDDDDEEDYAIAVIPRLSTEEPDNSLSMRDEHIDTVSAMESDEFIKSSVETLPIPENESFHFDIPLSSRPPAKPPDGNTGILNIKMMGDVSDRKVPILEFMITIVSNQEKSPNLLSHRGLENFQPSAECPMKIHGKNIPTLDVPHFHFYPP